MYLHCHRSFWSSPAFATAPQQLSVIYNPPALTFEDEMSYIASKGNVNGPAAATQRPSQAIAFQK
jgi:hypothetical protein